MLARIRRTRDRIQESLFYLPALGVVSAAGLAWLTTWVDNSRSDGLQGVPILLRTTVDSARSLLTTSAGATITVAGIVLSITVVAVQLAASQFSPRVVATVFGSRFQQTVIAIVTGTFTYDLIVLSTVRSEVGGLTLEATRSVSVTLALVLAVVSVMAIIAFIDRSVAVMQVGEILRRSADDTLSAIERTHPEHDTGSGAADESAMPDGPATTFRSRADGWVQQVDTAALLEAIPPGGVGRLDCTIGSFVGVGSPVVTIWTSREDPPVEIDPDRVRRAFEIGHTRSARIDPTFGVRQLVDVALRALSPGINDPTTANEVILHLTEILREVLVRDLPPRAVHGEEGRRLFRPLDWSRHDWVRHAFAEIRNASSSQPAVALALVSSMGSLLDHLEDEQLEGRADPLRTEARLVLAGLEASEHILDDDVDPVRRLAMHHRLIDGPEETGAGTR